MRRFGAPETAITAYQKAGIEQLASFFAKKGQVLFGTDVGYMRDFSSSQEFKMMALAGMEFNDILASLTTSPAKRFGNVGETATVEIGQAADLVIFHSDPRDNLSNFSDIALTIKSGKIIYRKD